jgi:hypothetical protein
LRRPTQGSERAQFGPRLTWSPRPDLFCAASAAEIRWDVGRADWKTPGPNSKAILAGGRRMDAGRSRVSVRRSEHASHRLCDSSTTACWLKSPLSPALAKHLPQSQVTNRASLWSAVPRRTCSDDPHRRHRRSSGRARRTPAPAACACVMSGQVEAFTRPKQRAAPS